MTQFWQCVHAVHVIVKKRVRRGVPQRRGWCAQPHALLTASICTAGPLPHTTTHTHTHTHCQSCAAIQVALCFRIRPLRKWDPSSKHGMEGRACTLVAGLRPFELPRLANVANGSMKQPVFVDVLFHSLGALGKYNAHTCVVHFPFDMMEVLCTSLLDFSQRGNV